VIAWFGFHPAQLAAILEKAHHGQTRILNLQKALDLVR
jgi:hypothetical protein